MNLLKAMALVHEHQIPVKDVIYLMSLSLSPVNLFIYFRQDNRNYVLLTGKIPTPPSHVQNVVRDYKSDINAGYHILYVNEELLDASS